MKIIGIIPARFASTRLPGKPLLLIKGKPMIQRVYEQSSKSKLIDKVIVATDEKRIFDLVNNFGGNAVMTSKKHLSGTDRIAEVAKKIRCSIVVNIQGDEPFINPSVIDLAIKPLIKNKSINVSTLAFRFIDKDDLADRNKVKVIFDKNNFAIYFSRNVIPSVPANSDFSKFGFYKHIGLYVYRKNFLLKFLKMKKSSLEKAEMLEQLRILENGEKIKVVLTNKDSVSIDTMEDFKLINKND